MTQGIAEFGLNGPNPEKWALVVVPVGEAAMDASNRPPKLTLAVLDAFSHGCADEEAITVRLNGSGLAPKSGFAQVELSNALAHYDADSLAQATDMALRLGHLDFEPGNRPGVGPHHIYAV